MTQRGLIPLGGFNLEKLPEMEPARLENPQLTAMGVWFTFEGENLDAIREMIEAWYENRDEVVLLDFGLTDKEKQGCMIMEWQGYAPDQLFLDILRTEERILDYCVYEVQA